MPIGVQPARRSKYRTVHLEGPDGSTVAWNPSEISGRRGGTEVYHAETVELRAGDRIRWTRNDKGLGLVYSSTVEILGVRNWRVTFLLEEGRKLTLTPGRSATAPSRLRMGFDRARLPGPHRR